MAPRMTAALHLAMAASTAAATVRMAWTTQSAQCIGGQEECRLLGPDGPWQAVLTMAGQGSSSQSDSAGHVMMPMWPSVGYESAVVTSSSGGEYDPSKSISANASRVSYSQFGPWLAPVFMTMNNTGVGYHEIFTLYPDLDEINATMIAADTWDVSFPNGKTYNPPAGFLGLGPSPSGDSGPRGGPPGLLEQLKSTGKITSNSYGLHMGSAALGQLGSLILGGYEQNRALGDVGVFDLTAGAEAAKVFLRDVTLGVEAGGSPFQTSGSMWQGLGDNEHGRIVTKSLGGVEGSVAILPNPVTPYIYLPPGTCEAVAAQLPVTWNAGLGLYIWNTEAPQFARIVNSPAYMGFVLADKTATNITIKIPFKLLNLTLEAPLVDTPTPYFPCQPRNSSYGVWQLGRAFLQGAFLGINYDKGVMYLAQAPGPDMEQSVVRTLEVDDEAIRTNAGDSFARTWGSSWTVLEAEEGTDAGAGKGDGEPAPANDGKSDEVKGGISTGMIAGIVVGAVALLALVGTWVWFCLRQRRRGAAEAAATAPWKPEQSEASGRETPQEMHAPNVVHLAPGGVELRHEMDGGVYDFYDSERKM